jgi:hypothetical protein
MIIPLVDNIIAGKKIVIPHAELLPQIFKDLEGINAVDMDRIVAAIGDLEQDVRPSGVKKLRGVGGGQNGANYGGAGPA